MSSKKPKKRKKKIIGNDAWIATHFEEIVDKYAGKHIVVSGGKIFTGKDAVKKAKTECPNIIPTSMPVPSPKELRHHILSLSCPAS